MSAHDGDNGGGEDDGVGPGANGSGVPWFTGSSALVGDYGDGAAARRGRLLALLDGDGRRPPGPDVKAPGSVAGRAGEGLLARLGRVCAVAVSEVRVDGAGVTVMGSLEGGLAGARDQLAATGALTRRLEDLQLTTGEGPCLDAYRWGRPVLAAEIAREPARWLGFGPEALRVGAAAVFSLPLQVGAVRLGTLDLHRRVPGSLSNQQLSDALTLATLATEILLELGAQAGRADTPDGPERADVSTLPMGGWLPDVHADVHVAAGMISAQAGIPITNSLLRLRGYAYARGEPLHQVARRIIDRELILDRPDRSGRRASRGEHDPPDEPPALGPENEET